MCTAPAIWRFTLTTTIQRISGQPRHHSVRGPGAGTCGLYQINVQVPASGLGAGDNVYIEFVTDAADVNQIQIPYGSRPRQFGHRGATARPSPARPGHAVAKQKACDSPS